MTEKRNNIIRQEWIGGKSYIELGEKYGLKPITVERIVKKQDHNRGAYYVCSMPTPYFNVGVKLQFKETI